jgi:hypothetical protein
VPFLDECRTVESDKAEFIIFDVGDDIKKSNSLSDWPSLLEAYGEYEGDVFEFKPTEKGNLWIKTSYNSKMKLKEWNTVSCLLRKIYITLMFDSGFKMSKKSL